MHGKECILYLLLYTGLLYIGTNGEIVDEEIQDKIRIKNGIKENKNDDYEEFSMLKQVDPPEESASKLHSDDPGVDEESYLESMEELAVDARRYASNVLFELDKMRSHFRAEKNQEKEGFLNIFNEEKEEGYADTNIEVQDYTITINEEKELSQEEKKSIELYERALQTLNSSRGNKVEAYDLLKEASELGHVESKLMVGWAHLLGATLPQNVDTARIIFEELKELGVADAYMGLGFMYAAGISVNASQTRALVHYTIGALGGSVWARMALGYRFWAGITVSTNCEQSLDYYRLVANKVASEVQMSGGTIILRVRLMDEVDNPGYNSGILDNDLIEYYQLLAEKGDVQAQVGLGQLHYQGGRGVVQDPQRALHYFLQAADAGNPIAMAFLGRIYLEGSELVKADNATAYKYFKKAADMGNPVGQSGLGIMHLHGRGVERDYSKALKYFSQAADQGWVDGQLQLGIMHFSGLGVRRDYKMANKYFTLASQSGHVLAFYNLAQMHATGTGIMRSCSTAVELYKNVAERGKWGEKLMEAHTHYREGRMNEAFITYALLSELGYEVAQSNVAFMLDKGDVTLLEMADSEMYVRALMYWSRAAAQGHSPAQVKLGDYFYYGLGTGVDYELAAMHYRQASEQQHNAQAMFNLGYMHEQGLGMQQDMHLAKRCYDMAAETSSDAKVPVALALMKLSLLFTMKYLQESNWDEWFFIFNLNQLLGPNWDIYLFSILVGLLGIMFYFRRLLRR